MILSIPSIITRKRSTGVIVSLILSSAIFVTSYTLINAMNNVNNDFFGESDDVLVFYNPETLTPFTSNIPRILETSFNDIEGVNIVSPEIFFPAVLQGEPVYGRGVRFEKILKLDNSEIINGYIPQSSYEILLGESLANRLDITVSDIIEIYSIIEEEVIKVKVSGIYRTESITSDEILVDLSLGSRFSAINENKFTHIRAKYDNSIISEKEILSLALETFPISLNPEFGNGTKVIDSYTISIEDLYGNLIYQDPLSDLIEISVVRGKYKISIEGEDYSNSFLSHINKKQDLTILIDEYIFDLNLSVEYDGESVPELQFEIYKENSTTSVVSNYTDNLGNIDLTLPEGKYYIKFPDYIETGNISLDLTSPISDILSLSIQGSDFDILKNGTLFLDSDINIFLGLGDLSPKELSMYKFFANKTQIPLNYQQRVHLNLADGKYMLKLYRGSNLLQKKWIQVNGSLDFISSPITIINAHFTPGSLLEFELHGIVDYTFPLHCTTVESNPSKKRINCNVPSNAGFYSYNFDAIDEMGKQMRKYYRFIVDSTEDNLGWLGPVPIPVAIPGDKLAVWSKHQIVDVDKGSIEPIGDTYWYTIPDNSSGIYTSKSILNITITTTRSSQLLQILLLSDYESLFLIRNTTHSTTLVNGTDIASREINIYTNPNFIDSLPLNMGVKSKLIYSFNTNFWTFTSLLHDFQLGSTVILNGGWQILRIKNTITGSTDDIFLQINSGDPSIYPIPAGGLKTVLNDGIIDHIDDNGELLLLNITKNDKVYQPVNLNKNSYKLSPGNYNITISYVNQSISTKILKSWFEVPIQKIQPDASIKYIAINWGYVYNETPIQVYNAEYYVNLYSQRFLYYSSYLQYYRDYDNENYIISLPYASEGNFTLTHQSLSTTYQYLGDVRLNETNDLENWRFNATFIDNTGILHTVQHNFILGKRLNNYTINFTNITKNILDPILINIYLEEQDREYIYLITAENSSVTINTIEQYFTLEYKIDSIIHSERIYLQNNITLDIGDPIVSFSIFNRNTGLYENNARIKLSNYYSAIIQQSSLSFPIIRGEYNISYIKGIYQGYTIINITQNQIYNLEFELVVRDLDLSILNIPTHPSNFTINHSKGIWKFDKIIEFSNTYFKLEDIPIGDLFLEIKGEWGSWNTTYNFEGQIDNFIVDIRGEFSELDGISYEIDIPHELDVIKVDFVKSGDYLKEFLSGALVIINTILITQILIILIILIYNIIEISNNLTHESRREILMIKSIGATDNQTIFSYSKLIFITTIPIAIIGQGIAALLMYLLVISNSTVFFGHKFIPQVLEFKVFILNYFISLFNLIIGLKFAYRNEFNKI